MGKTIYFPRFTAVAILLQKLLEAKHLHYFVLTLLIRKDAEFHPSCLSCACPKTLPGNVALLPHTVLHYICAWDERKLDCLLQLVTATSRRTMPNSFHQTVSGAASASNRDMHKDVRHKPWCEEKIPKFHQVLKPTC